MPDLYLDPKRKLEYAREMANKAPNDTSPNEKAYWDEQVRKLSASRTGHAEMTKRAQAEIERRLAARDKRKGL